MRKEKKKLWDRWAVIRTDEEGARIECAVQKGDMRQDGDPWPEEVTTVCGEVLDGDFGFRHTQDMINCQKCTTKLSTIDWDIVELRWPADKQIAENLGVSRQTVHAQRTRRGIEKSTEDRPEVKWHSVDWRFSDKYLAVNMDMTQAEVKAKRPKDF